MDYLIRKLQICYKNLFNKNMQIQTLYIYITYFHSPFDFQGI